MYLLYIIFLIFAVESAQNTANIKKKLFSTIEKKIKQLKIIRYFKNSVEK